MPKLTIDGQTVEAPATENIILAARRIGREIPTFCYHEKLTIAANCRICLVEIEKSPKLQPACQQMVTEGMVVHTQSKKAIEARAAVMEFLLVNHPLDCPICDKAGECKLQDYYMLHDARNSRTKEVKVEKPRLEVLGPLVNYNAERCIMCTRCVRFMAEVAHDPQLGCFNRADHAVIGTFPGQPLDNPYSLNVVELCPVGALGNLDFRFESRVWQLDKTSTICGGCSKGCNTEIHHKHGLAYRLIPRRNDAVNSTWMCDEGRLSYHEHNEKRADEPLLAGKPATHAAASEAARSLMQAAIGDKGKGWSVFISPTLTVEDAYAWLSVIATELGQAKVTVSGRPAGEGDKLLRRADKNPNRAGLEAMAGLLGVSLSKWADGVGAASAQKEAKVIVLGTELPDATLDAVVSTASRALVIGSNRTAAYETAEIALPGASHFESDGSFVNEEKRVQRLRPIMAARFGAKQAFVWATELLLGAVNAPNWPNAETIFAEIAKKSPDFAGMKLLGLGQAGKPLTSAAPAVVAPGVENRA